jgi:hypothetical protein
VGVPVIRAGAVEAGVDQDGEGFEIEHAALRSKVNREAGYELFIQPDGKSWSAPY